MAENTASAKADDTPGGKRQSRSATGNPSFDMTELQALMELVNEQGFTEFEFENENIRIRLGRGYVGQSIPVPQVVSPATGEPAAKAVSTVGEAPAQADADDALHKITSPIVGTFYRSPGPDKDPYVKEGSNVTPDSVVCIVEAMKLMNEIQAEVTGEVVKVYVENGQPVEFGQPLFGIKK